MSASAPTRLLILRTGAMGDILHALPAVTALRAAHPDWHIGWAVEPRWSPLLPPKVVDQIHPVPTRAWKQRPLAVATLREIAALRRQLRAQHYDLAVDLQGSIRSALIGRLASATHFFGPAHPRERQARAFYQTRIPTHHPHVIDQACELLSAATDTTLTASALRIPPTEAAKTWFARTVSPRRGKGYILIAPTAGWGAKQWPADRYTFIAAHFLAQGYRVLINAAPEPDPIPGLIAAQSGAELIPSTVAQLIPLTHYAELVLGGDTGPVHLAAAQRTPVVALFGPTDPTRNGPSFPGARVTILRDPSSHLDHRRHADPDPGLLKITVNQVLEAAQALLDSPTPAPTKTNVGAAHG